MYYQIVVELLSQKPLTYNNVSAAIEIYNNVEAFGDFEEASLIESLILEYSEIEIEEIESPDEPF